MVTDAGVRKGLERAGRMGFLICYRGYQFAQECGLDVVQVFVRDGYDHWVFRSGGTDLEVREDGKCLRIFGKKPQKGMAPMLELGVRKALWKFGRSMMIRGTNPKVYINSSHPAVRKAISEPMLLYNTLIIPTFLELINAQGIKPKDIAEEIGKMELESRGFMRSGKEPISAEAGKGMLAISCGKSEVKLPIVMMPDFLERYKQVKSGLEMCRLFIVMGDRYIPGSPFMLIGGFNQHPDIPPAEMSGDAGVVMGIADKLGMAFANSLWKEFNIKEDPDAHKDK
jgi:hypothetical protein